MYKLLPILLFAFGLAVTSDELYDNSYALIIGISEYDALNPYNSYLNLDYGASDAEAIQTLLISQYYFPVKNTTLLKNEEATKHNILKSLSDFNFLRLGITFLYELPLNFSPWAYSKSINSLKILIALG